MKHTLIALGTIFSLLLSGSSVRASSTPTFTWDTTTVAGTVGTAVTLSLRLDTATANTTGADVLLKYDPTTVEVNSVAYTGNPYPSSFQHIDATAGTIRISSTFTDLASKFAGAQAFAQITFTPKRVGSGAFSFVCQPGATNDTNILATQTANDIVDCTSLAISTVTIAEAQTTASPTPTPTPAPTTSDSLACTAPAGPTNLRATAQSADSVLLQWNKGTNSTGYTLQFGLKPNVYLYGASNLGDTDKFLVNYLQPGKTYYFALAGTNACAVTGFITTSGTTKGKTAGTTVRTSVSRSVSQKVTDKLVVVAPSFDNLVTPTPSEQPVAAVPVAKAAKVGFPWLSLGLIVLVMLVLLGLLYWFFFGRRAREESEEMQPVESIPPSPPLS